MSGLNFRIFLTVIDIQISFSPVDLQEIHILPGVRTELSLAFELTNLNEPDMNFDTAEVEVPRQGANFEFTVRVVDVDLTQTDDVTYEVASVEQVLSDGNVSAALNSSGQLLFNLTYHVRQHHHNFSA